MNKYLVLFISILLFSSCATYQHVRIIQAPETFVGISHQEVVRQLGAPSNEFSDGAGGYILAYEGNKTVFQYGRKYVKNSDTMPTLQLFFNSEGYCTRAITTNTQPVKAVSAWWTTILVLGLLLLLYFNDFIIFRFFN